MALTSIPSSILEDEGLTRELLAFLRNPISLKSADYAMAKIGDRPATRLYGELVSTFLAMHPEPSFRRINATDFRRALPGSGFPQSLFRRTRVSPDQLLQPRLNYWQDLADDTCGKLGQGERQWDTKLLPRFISVFGLHEQLFWTICGVAHFQLIDGVDVSLPSRDHQGEAFLRWFSGYLTDQAETALFLKIFEIAGINPFVDSCQDQVLRELTSKTLTEISELILDACYSINQRYVEKVAVQGLDFEKSKRFVKWIGFLSIWCFLFPDQFFSPNDPLVSSLDLSLEEIPNLTSLAYQHNGLDAVIELGANGSFRLKSNSYSGHITGITREYVIPSDVISNLGTWFEKDYLASYISEDINRDQYQIHKGFKPNGNDKVRGYDIDFILEDLRRNVFYFVQVKYQSKSFLPYLHDEYESLFMQKNGGISKGVGQLVALRGKFHDEQVLRYIRGALNRQISAEQLERTVHFVLLHNLNSYDLAQLGEIPLYNWNFFRNLLRGGMNHREISAHGTTVGRMRYREPLPLENAHAVASLISDTMENVKEKDISVRESWELYCAARVSISSTSDPNIKVSIGLT